MEEMHDAVRDRAAEKHAVDIAHSTLDPGRSGQRGEAVFVAGVGKCEVPKRLIPLEGKKR